MATAFRWGGRILKMLMSIFSGFHIPKMVKIGCVLTEIFKKNKNVDFWGGHMVYPKCTLDIAKHALGRGFKLSKMSDNCCY